MLQLTSMLTVPCRCRPFTQTIIMITYFWPFESWEVCYVNFAKMVQGCEPSSAALCPLPSNVWTVWCMLCTPHTEAFKILDAWCKHVLFGALQDDAKVVGMDRKGSDVLIIIYGAKFILSFFFFIHSTIPPRLRLASKTLSRAVNPRALLLISARGAR